MVVLPASIRPGQTAVEPDAMSRPENGVTRRWDLREQNVEGNSPPPCRIDP